MPETQTEGREQVSLTWTLGTVEVQTQVRLLGRTYNFSLDITSLIFKFTFVLMYNRLLFSYFLL